MFVLNVHTKTILLSSFSSTLLSLFCFPISASIPPYLSTITYLSLPPLFPSHPPCTSFLAHIAAWTWHPWLGCGAHGRNCPASTRSCLEICRMSSTLPGTWLSTATSWAARACNHPSSHCSQLSRRTSPSYMKVDDFVESPEFLNVAFFMY